MSLVVRLVPSHMGTLQEKLSGALAGLHVGHHQTAWMNLKDQFFSKPKPGIVLILPGLMMLPGLFASLKIRPFR